MTSELILTLIDGDEGVTHGKDGDDNGHSKIRGRRSAIRGNKRASHWCPWAHPNNVTKNTSSARALGNTE